MTPAEFKTAACAILRTTVGWQTGIAKRLNVQARTVRYWLARGIIPPNIEAEILAMMGGVGQSPFPRDEWVIGDTVGGDGKRREYIVHLQAPRFIARVVATDDDGEPEESEWPCDTVSGTVYTSLGHILCEIEWIDKPAAGEVVKWLEAACDAVDAAE